MATNTFSNIAKPVTTASPFSIPTRTTASPFSTALNNMSSGVRTSPPPTPSTPLKSTTMNNVDGSSVTHTYHAPVTDTASKGASNIGLTRDDVVNNLSKAGYDSSAQQNPTGVVSNPSPNLVGTNQSPQPTPQEPINANAQYLNQGVGVLSEAGKVGQEAGLLRQAIARETQDVMGNPYYSGSVRLGRAGIIQQNQGSQLQALTDQQKALTGQGQGFISAAQTAAPVTQFGLLTNPQTGKAISSQGGAQNPQTQAVNYAQDVLSGKRSYDDAVQGMALYGNAGKQFLDDSIRQSNPQFNFAQAQTLGAQQGALAPAYSFAKQALSNVENAISNLSSVQKTNIPLLNAVSNYGSLQTGIGSEQTRGVIGAVQTLRNAYAALLASARGGTPTDYSSQATAEIPDQPTPNDIAAIKANFEKLGGARVGVYGNPGQASTGAPTASAPVFNW